MLIYTLLTYLLFVINVLLFLVFKAYRLLVNLDKEKKVKLYPQLITIKIMGDAFLFISLGVVFFSSFNILSGFISRESKFFDFVFFVKFLGLDKAISMEESFKINFVILFAYVGIIYRNDIWKNSLKLYNSKIEQNEQT